LWSFDLLSSSLTRLTTGDQNDISPSIASDGHSVAFASDRSGFWDLYVMDLRDGSTKQITETPEYDGSPAWSPDMAWLAYETLSDGQLDISMLSMTDVNAEPVLLTADPASDHSPAWSPDGRRLAFISNRTGDADVWLADLNEAADRFTNISQTPQAAESHPAWRSDGSQLAWSSRPQGTGTSGVYVWDTTRSLVAATWIANGFWPAWDAKGDGMAAVLESPTQQLISVFTLSGTPLILPSHLAGVLRGLAWSRQPLAQPLPKALQLAQGTIPTVVTPSVVAPPDVPSERWYIVPMEDVQASSAGLHALVEPSFTQLRQRVIREAGWDALASLENAFVPFTTPLEPGLEQDWLYTGRAFAINTLMLNAGWMAVQREDIGDGTYWRVFIRVRNQDGSQGIPLRDPPWDLNTRYQLDPRAYEAGGSYAPVPPGYWLDLTSLAQAYGWQRLPAIAPWRTYYSGARFTEFVNTGGLDWYSAMLELYPPEALITPTAVLPPTITPSRTPRPTATDTATSTPRNTLTPSITPTASVTRTPSITPTPLPPSHTPPPSPTPPTVIPTFPTSTP
jgi:TolB protein